MEELVRPHVDDTLEEYLARMGLNDGRIKQQPLREVIRHIVELSERDGGRLREDALLQAIHDIAERALEADSGEDEG
jgi:hypothetical protein